MEYIKILLKKCKKQAGAELGKNSVQAGIGLYFNFL